MTQIREDLEDANDAAIDGPELQFLDAKEIGSVHFERYALGDGPRFILAPNEDDPIVVVQTWSSGTYTPAELDALGPSAESVAMAERSGGHLGSTLLERGIVETWVAPAGGSIEHGASSLLATKSAGQRDSSARRAGRRAPLVVLSGRLDRREVLIALRTQFKTLAETPSIDSVSDRSVGSSWEEIAGWLRWRRLMPHPSVEARVALDTSAHLLTDATRSIRAQWSPAGAPESFDVWIRLEETETASSARARLLDSMAELDPSPTVLEEARRSARVELQTRLEDPIARAWLLGVNETLGQLDELGRVVKGLHEIEPTLLHEQVDQILHPSEVE